MEQEQFRKDILPLKPQLLNYARNILENEEDAEDIIQEVFFKLWSMRKDLEQYNSIPALCMTITRNLSINQIKTRNKKQNTLLEISFIDTGLSPDKRLEQKDEVESVMKIIETLPDMQQMILKMKHVEGLETEEIAELTGCSHEAIRVNLSRARKKIKDLFIKN
ncbi:MAG TPA: RNA polymerase subunit sigma-70 [Dysgonomonas sp.]|nr:RNA polymerase subunit sigma-70 [Dysgonomonas sp.]